jgi:hypothetical protein
MAITLNITGTLSLNINDGTNYLLDWESNGTSLFEPGTVAWRRDMITAPYVHGAFEANAVKDIVQASVELNIFAASQAALKTAVTNLINAFSQSTYTLTLGVDGESYAWTCLRADYHIRPDALRTFDDSARKWMRGTFSFPRQPVAVTGPF